MQEIMCAKIEVIWRWSKKPPHSGGTIWSLKPVFEQRSFFPPPPNHPNFLLHGDPHVPNMSMKGNLEKNIFYSAPLRYRPMFWSVSLEGSINLKTIQKNIKLWKPSFICARGHVCKSWVDLEVLKKITAFRRGQLKAVFEQRWIFPPPPNHPNFLVHGDPQVPNMAMN